MNTNLRASYEGSPGHWWPVIRRGKLVVWRGEWHCGNRDQTTPSNWGACNVAARVLAAVLDRDKFVARQLASKQWAAHAHLTSWQHADVQANDKMDEWALAEADRIRAEVLQ